MSPQATSESPGNYGEGDAPDAPKAHDGSHGSAGAAPSQHATEPEIFDEQEHEQEDDCNNDEYGQDEYIATTTGE